jgi:hypothetical protein
VTVAAAARRRRWQGGQERCARGRGMLAAAEPYIREEEGVAETKP